MKKLLLGLLLTAGAPGAAAAAPCDTADMLRAMSLATQPAPIVSPVTITPGMLIAFQGPGMRALHDSDVQARLAFRFRSYPNTTSIPPNPLLLSSFVTTSNYYFFGPDRINVRVPDSIPPGVTDVQIWVEFAPSLCPSGAQWAGFQWPLINTPAFAVSATPSTGAPPDAAAGLHLRQVTEDSAFIGWGDLTNEDGYRLRHREVGTSHWQDTDLGPDTRAHIIEGLSADTSY